MNTKHHLVISGIVGGVIGSLLTALLVSPVTAQRDKFGDIECTKLKVVDADGKARVILSTNPYDAEDGLLSEYGVFIGSRGDNGSVFVNGNDGKSQVSLGLDERGGRVDAYGKDGLSQETLAISEHGGFVQVKGNREGVAAMSVNEYGNGVVPTWDKNGNRQ